MVSSDDAAPATGQRRIAGRYRLTAALGSGAMGTVWSGFDEVLRRPVAIKELKVPHGVPQGETSALRERMLREARALGGLSHPNVITVFDVVDVAGNPFVVLELLPSRNLSTLIAENVRLSAEQAAVIGIAVADALRAAHRAEITHRDVKPGNVLVADDGRIKLTDFGIARNAADAPMTTTGLVLGSPAYIAPEVAAGRPVTPAADLWGLGATLFAAVEGRPPYDVGGDPVATVTAVVDGAVPRPSEPGPLADVIVDLMVKDPAQRLPLSEVRRRLRPLISDPDDPLFPELEPELTTTELSTTGLSSTGLTAASLAAGLVPAGPSAPAMPGTSPGGGGAHRQPEPNGTGPTGPALKPGRAPPSRPDPGRADPGRADERRADERRADELLAAPLAASPGPLPADYVRPASHVPVRYIGTRPARTRTALSAVPLILAGALVVLAAAAGGWALTRAIAGQSPLSSTLAGSSHGTSATSDAVTLVEHADSTAAYGTGGLGFSAKVPSGWQEIRVVDTLGKATIGVRFVSPDGTDELRIDRLTGTRAHPATAAEAVAALTAERLGVDKITMDSGLAPVGQAGAQQLRYRTEKGGLQKATFLRVLPKGFDLFEVRLTVPLDRAENMGQSLYTAIGDAFRP